MPERLMTCGSSKAWMQGGQSKSGEGGGWIGLSRLSELDILTYFCFLQ